MSFIYGFLFILLLIIASSIGFLIGLNIAKKNYDIIERRLKERISSLLRQNSTLNSSLRYYQSIASENNKVANHYKRLYDSKCRNIRGNQISDEMLKEAFKKLMIYSHPDKGNCKDSSDFIKYKDIYDKIK